uniref:Uncharacterized protein n=1 Tax=Fusarium oxysporum (strain Fo5176) TaxID=660025 RepID=A0A0D2YGA5_FUSOF
MSESIIPLSLFQSSYTSMAEGGQWETWIQRIRSAELCAILQAWLSSVWTTAKHPRTPSRSAWRMFGKECSGTAAKVLTPTRQPFSHREPEVSKTLHFADRYCVFL